MKHRRDAEEEALPHDNTGLWRGAPGLAAGAHAYGEDVGFADPDHGQHVRGGGAQLGFWCLRPRLRVGAGEIFP